MRPVVAGTRMSTTRHVSVSIGPAQGWIQYRCDGGMDSCVWPFCAGSKDICPLSQNVRTCACHSRCTHVVHWHDVHTWCSRTHISTAGPCTTLACTCTHARAKMQNWAPEDPPAMGRGATGPLRMIDMCALTPPSDDNSWRSHRQARRWH